MVREMFRWLAEGTSVRGVVARLNRLPVIPKARRAKLWGKSSVRRILTSETYVGRYWYNRREKATDGRMKLRDESEWFAIDVPPIVDRATFERVRQQLDRYGIGPALGPGCYYGTPTEALDAFHAAEEVTGS